MEKFCFITSLEIGAIIIAVIHFMIGIAFIALGSYGIDRVDEFDINEDGRTPFIAILVVVIVIAILLFIVHGLNILGAMKKIPACLIRSMIFGWIHFVFCGILFFVGIIVLSILQDATGKRAQTARGYAIAFLIVGFLCMMIQVYSFIAIRSLFISLKYQRYNERSQQYGQKPVYPQ